ncbi:hypothetical protein TCAL_15110 [Tigriopus californicus]|uniref:Uncharacterized protein n=1 Tax=Tigriopus californicus TaxID=6832 RepID=A0A553NVM7_TIGCA|nr:hypothetical protein TCAL_15110 [Tigriopus californicus]
MAHRLGASDLLFSVLEIDIRQEQRGVDPLQNLLNALINATKVDVLTGFLQTFRQATNPLKMGQKRSLLWRETGSGSNQNEPYRSSRVVHFSNLAHVHDNWGQQMSLIRLIVLNNFEDLGPDFIHGGEEQASIRGYQDIGNIVDLKRRRGS